MATFREKQEIIRKNRKQNYIESLRLEGISPPTSAHGETKEEVIEYWIQKGQDGTEDVQD